MKILIAEDEQYIWKPYKIALENRGHNVVITENGQDCINTYKRVPVAVAAGKNYNTYNNKHHHPPFDAVVLDYRMPGKDGMEVAKEILELNPKQRIIFASAYVKETLEDSVKQLRQVVELIQKPFEANVLVDIIEDKEAFEGLKKLMINVKDIEDKNYEPTSDQISDLFESLRKIQKGRSF
ncbi:MAG: response regulator [Nitrososphaeraceae archaeon]|nr:response regulator [Nitrososphaeraceae archaeon]MBV9667847.1 response regulator [Nitrososphaeraceae archaeon]